MRDYHDLEWGVPEHDSRALWEKLVLDSFQAGLSWQIILNKRDSFRTAFCGFDPATVARFGDADVARLLVNAGIVRSRAKIAATIRNARAYLAMQDSGEDFSQLAWSIVDGVPLRGDGRGSSTRSPAADVMSGLLKAKGFSFVGPVIVHAWMQATGLIDDHEETCFRRQHAG